MLKKELVREIAKSTSHTQKLVSEIIEAYHETVMNTVAGGENVKIVGFGTYGTRKVSAKEIKLKGRVIKSTEKFKPRFSSSKEFTRRTVEGV